MRSIHCFFIEMPIARPGEDNVQAGFPRMGAQRIYRDKLGVTGVAVICLVMVQHTLQPEQIMQLDIAMMYGHQPFLLKMGEGAADGLQG